MSDLAFVILLVFIFGGLSFENLQESYDNRAFAAAGLEECPNFETNKKGDTIWVKDCKLLLETHKEGKKDEKDSTESVGNDSIYISSDL